MEKIKTWIMLDNLFIDEDNIRSVRKNGKQTIIERIQGDPIISSIDYDKVKLLIKEI